MRATTRPRTELSPALPQEQPKATQVHALLRRAESGASLPGSGVTRQGWLPTGSGRGALPWPHQLLEDACRPGPRLPPNPVSKATLPPLAS